MQECQSTQGFRPAAGVSENDELTSVTAMDEPQHVLLDAPSSDS